MNNLVKAMLNYLIDFYILIKQLTTIGVDFVNFAIFFINLIIQRFKTIKVSNKNVKL